VYKEELPLFFCQKSAFHGRNGSRSRAALPSRAGGGGPNFQKFLSTGQEKRGKKDWRLRNRKGPAVCAKGRGRDGGRGALGARGEAYQRTARPRSTLEEKKILPSPERTPQFSRRKEGNAFLSSILRGAAILLREKLHYFMEKRGKREAFSYAVRGGKAVLELGVNLL